MIQLQIALGWLPALPKALDTNETKSRQPIQRGSSVEYNELALDPPLIIILPNPLCCVILAYCYDFKIKAACIHSTT